MSRPPNLQQVVEARRLYVEQHRAAIEHAHPIFGLRIPLLRQPKRADVADR